MLKLIKTLNVGGAEWEINTDFRTCIEIMQLCEDPNILDEDKPYLAQGILFVKTIPPELLREAELQASWFLDGGWDVPSSGGSSPGRLYSWVQDLRYIIQATDKVLGYSSRAQEELHWWIFLGAFSEIEESVFGMLVHQRKLRKTGKQSREDKEWWSDNIDIAKLKGQETAEELAKKEEFEKLLKGER